MLTIPLLRSVLHLTGDETDEALSANLYALRSEVEPEGIDQKILEHVGHIYDRARAMPTFNEVVAHYTLEEGQGKPDGSPAVTRLAQIMDDEPWLQGSAFRYALDEYKEKIAHDLLGQALMEASTILGAGLMMAQLTKKGDNKQVMVQGTDAAHTHIVNRLGVLSQRVKQGAIEGDLRTEGNKVRRAYEVRRANPAQREGILTGLRAFDAVHYGLVPGDLALVMAFTSHLKTTFCLNWLYRACVHQGKNVALVSLEVTAAVMRTLLFVLHASHLKFRTRLGFNTITYDKVDQGTLNEDEAALWEEVILDMEHNPEYGRIYYREPQETTIEEIKQWAEMRHRITPLSLLVIDYLALVDPERGKSSLAEAQHLNIVIRKAKTLATSFAGGQGIAVVSPFQANREGYKDAMKNGGRYNLTALAWANEAERSSDMVYTLYLDSVLIEAHEVLCGNLKSRNRKLVTEMVKAYADPATRLIAEANLLDPIQQPVTF